MAVLNYTQPWTEYVDVTFTLQPGQATNVPSVGVFYPFGQTGIGFGLTGGEDNSNQYSFTILDVSVISALPTDLSLTYTINGVTQPKIINSVNSTAQSLNVPMHLLSSYNIPAQTGFSIVAYPKTVNTNSAAVQEVVTLKMLIIPPKLS